MSADIGDVARAIKTKQQAQQCWKGSLQSPSGRTEPHETVRTQSRTTPLRSRARARTWHLPLVSSRAYNNKGYLPQRRMIPKNCTDKGDEWRSLQEEAADYVDTMTPGRRYLPRFTTRRTSLMISGDTDEVRQGDGATHQPLEAATEDH